MRIGLDLPQSDVNKHVIDDIRLFLLKRCVLYHYIQSLHFKELSALVRFQSHVFCHFFNEKKFCL